MANMFQRSGRWLYDQPYLLLSLASLFWAGNFVLGRFVVGHVPPVTLSFLRWTGAFFIALPFAWPMLKRDWPLIKKHWPMLTVFSLTGTAGYNALAYWGLQYTQAVNALLMQSASPPLIALCALILFGDRLRPAQALGITISLVGAIIIICRGSLDVLLSVSFNRGDVVILFTVVVFALYSALAKRRPPLNAFAFLTVVMGWGTVLLLPALVWEIASGHVMKFDAVAFGTLAYVMIFPSLLAYFFFNRGVELAGPNRAAPFFHLMPVFGSALAILLLGERPELYHLVGYVLVLCGVFIATRKNNRI